MDKITISKVRYAQLKKQADAYKKFVSQFYTLAIKDPINEVINDLKKTNLYSDEFINDIEDGLRKSSYAKTI
ncbi:MAG: hypothetical protein V1655_02135 [bacterium]